ncbi:hypothetical protein Back2_24470 [Nocardioides baekrokdamisoli]|uniref:Uncharacterized protein n=2 Tax=Nocardioides baekrokdamisoli TaxID=1804624 RepID=A0A3G9IGI8_9ACTN|nr:hypothetical protein Back2_24470 [Nocardioides baekrokdamisoli]
MIGGSIGSSDGVDGLVLPVGGRDCDVQFLDHQGHSHVWVNRGGRSGCFWSAGSHHTIYLRGGDPSQATDVSPTTTAVIGAVIGGVGGILGVCSVAALRKRAWTWSESTPSS